MEEKISSEYLFTNAIEVPDSEFSSSQVLISTFLSSLLMLKLYERFIFKDEETMKRYNNIYELAKQELEE